MSGYEAPYIGLPDPEKKAFPMIDVLGAQQPVEERSDLAWYKKLSMSIKGHGKSNRSSMASTSAKSPAQVQQDYLNNKPLPPLPGPLNEQPPYFEYLFVDAGIKDETSDEENKSTCETDSDTQGKFPLPKKAEFG
jgi:hypothetical protein